MTKILFIHHAVGWGGAPNSLIKLINSLDPSKYEAEVLLLKDSIVSEKLLENGIKYRVASSIFYEKYYAYFTHSEAGYVKWYHIYRIIKLSILWILSCYYFSKKELLKHDFDIVHLNSSVLTDWLVPASKKGKVIIHIREPFRKGRIDILHYLFTRQMRRYANVIIAISRDNAERINIPEKTIVVYNFTDIVDKIPLQESYSSKKVLYVGGKSPIKGFHTLIDALPFIDDDIKVLFAGDYPSQTTYQKGFKKVLKQFLPKSVKRQKALYSMRNSNKSVEIGLIKDISNALDEVCCLVSPFSVEHFSRPIIEAFAHQKGVIATNLEGTKEIVTDNYNGLLVEVNNPKKLANAINYITNNPELCLKFGQNGYDVAKDKYSSKNVSIIEEVYSRL